MPNTSVGFVIVSYNASDLLARCLESLYRQTAGPVEVVVVDNGSDDGTQQRLRCDHRAARLIELGRNAGFAAACNVGITSLFANPACRYVGLINQDAWLAEDWLEKVLSFAEQRPKGAGFQGLTLDDGDHNVVDSYGLCIGPAGGAIQLGYRSRDFPLESGEVFGVNGAAALFSSAFLRSQPFGDEYLDSDLFMYLEDVDLSARAVMTGWENYFVSGAVAYHLGSGGGRENRLLTLRLTSRNAVLVLVKNLPWRVVLATIPGMARAEVARQLAFLKARQYRKVGTMISGPSFLRKRRVLQPYRIVAKDRLRCLMQGSMVVREVPPSPR
jgi:GT2 family glycosyltransferase